MQNEKGHYNQQYFVNEDFFKKPSAKLAYILGLYASDGNVHNGRISITQCGEHGLKLIEWIKETIGFDGNIYVCELENPKHSTRYTITFISKNVLKIFEKYNIEPKKSLIYEFPTKLPKKFWGDFMRGYIDGDGSVFTYVRKRNLKRGKEIRPFEDRCFTISLYGSIPFVEFVHSNLPVKSNKKIRYTGNGAEVFWNYKTGREFGSYIFSTDNLPRTKKEQTFKNFVLKPIGRKKNEQHNTN